jgi:hypothetical protein
MELLEGLVAVKVDGSLPNGKISPDWPAASKALGSLETGWSSIVAARVAQITREELPHVSFRLDCGKSLFYNNAKAVRHLKQQSNRIALTHLASELQTQHLRFPQFLPVVDQKACKNMASLLRADKEWIEGEEEHKVYITAVQKNIRAKVRVEFNMVEPTEGKATAAAEVDMWGNSTATEGDDSIGSDGIFSEGQPGTSVSKDANVEITAVLPCEEEMMFVNVLRPMERTDFRMLLKNSMRMPMSNEQQEVLKENLRACLDYNTSTGECDWVQVKKRLNKKQLPPGTQVYALYNYDGKIYKGTVVVADTYKVEIQFEGFETHAKTGKDLKYKINIENVVLCSEVHSKGAVQLGDTYSMDNVERVKRRRFTHKTTGRAIILELGRRDDEDMVSYRILSESSTVDASVHKKQGTQPLEEWADFANLLLTRADEFGAGKPFDKLTGAVTASSVKSRVVQVEAVEEKPKTDAYGNPIKDFYAGLDDYATLAEAMAADDGGNGDDAVADSRFGKKKKKKKKKKFAL